MPALLLLPALLAGAASVAWALRPGRPAVPHLDLGAALAAGLLAALAPDGAWNSPWLLLGARTGLDLAGRGALVAAAALLLLSRRGGGPAASPGAAPAWLALLAAGLCASAVALDAGLLAFGLAVLLFAAYGLAVLGPGGRRAAARFMAAAVAGEVLLVDALAEFGHAAESAHLELMRVAAGGELGLAAPLLLAGAFGLPILVAGLERLVLPAVALAAVGALATSRLAADLAVPPSGAAALAFLGFVALAALGGLLERVVLARWPHPRTPAGPDLPGKAAPPGVPGPRLASPAPWAAGPLAAGRAWLESTEARLGAAAGSGLLALLLIVALALRLALDG